VPVTRLLGTSHRNWTLVDIPYDETEARGVSRAVEHLTKPGYE